LFQHQPFGGGVQLKSLSQTRRKLVAAVTIPFLIISLAVSIPINTATPANAATPEEFVTPVNCWELGTGEVDPAIQGGFCGGDQHLGQEVMRFEVVGTKDFALPMEGVRGFEPDGRPIYDIHYRWEIDWGDGEWSPEDGRNSQGVHISHRYENSGQTYTITIRPGPVPEIGWFDAFGGSIGSQKIKFLTPFSKNSRTVHPVAFYQTFKDWSGAQNLPSNLFSGFIPDQQSNFSYMFNGTFDGYASESEVATIPQGLFNTIFTQGGEYFQSMFSDTFKDFGKNSKSATIPGNLFLGITAHLIGNFQSMFSGTFKNFAQSSTLATIPSHLFHFTMPIYGQNYSSMFKATFSGFAKNNTNAKIPERLFGKIDVFGPAENMFDHTFYEFGPASSLTATYYNNLNGNYSVTFTDSGYSWGIGIDSADPSINPTVNPGSDLGVAKFGFLKSDKNIRLENRVERHQGYTFGGWYSDPNYSQPFNFSQRYSFDTPSSENSVKLYTKWVAIPPAPTPKPVPVPTPSCGLVQKACSLTVGSIVKFGDLKKVSVTRKADINWLASTGVTVGSGCVNGGGSKCKYNPNADVNRGAMAEFMWKLVGQPAVTKPVPQIDDIVSFKKTNPNRYTAIRWLASEGITVIGDNDTYSPKNNVNRGAMAEFMYKLAGSPGVLDFGSAKNSHPDPATLTVEASKLKADKALTDLAATNPNRYYDILWLARVGITSGSNAAGTQFSPNNVVNRGSMAQFLHRLYNFMDSNASL
jgi:uncharacterized repeat protein (TIGR02543 family)